MDGPEINPNELNAVAAAAAVRSGEITSEQLVRSCLGRIEEIEDTVKAWAHLDPERALEQARQADEARQAGETLGPLHGIPVGVKDIFDTRDMPTEDGTVLHAGRQPTHDATAVSLLRQAGAVILGKTVTTELAVYAPAETTNPHDPARTPGGSSSGSAAAVATAMVPLAIGSQTNGSTIRPASYCGVFGFKPSHGLISRHRVLQQSRWLDQVGVFARTIEDTALLAEQLMAYDENDPDTNPRVHPGLTAKAAEDPPVTPNLAFVKTPVWDKAEDDTREAFTELARYISDTVREGTEDKVETLAGDVVKEVDLPEIFDQAHGWHRSIMEADIARSFEREYDTGRDKLSEILRGMIESGQKVLATDYNEAVNGIRVLNGALGPIFDQYDAILTPAVPGEAPVGLESTGSPAFCSIWTLCGTPAISLPIMEGRAGMPLGAQLVAMKGDDARLLRTARWLVELVSNP